jgi:hypothetical protein
VFRWAATGSGPGAAKDQAQSRSELLQGAAVSKPPERFRNRPSLSYERRYIFSVHSFHYRDGRLYCEEVDLAQVAQAFGTPLYIYSQGTVLDHYQRLDQALAPLDHLICYAVKANSNRAILKLLTNVGSGFDIVSGGELFRVLAAGGDPRKIDFFAVKPPVAVMKRMHGENVAALV